MEFVFTYIWRERERETRDRLCAILEKKSATFHNEIITIDDDDDDEMIPE